MNITKTQIENPDRPTMNDEKLISDYRRYYQGRPSNNPQVEQARRAMQTELAIRGYRISEL